MLNNKFFVAVLIGCCIISGTLFAQDKTVDQIVAVIGSNVVLKSDIEEVYLQNQAQGMTSDGDMKCEILEQLLVENLMVAEAQLDTLIIVTDNQINQQLDARIQYFIQHLGSEKEVENYFKKPIVQLKSELKDIINNELLSSQMKNKIIEKATVTPSEVRYFFKNIPEDQIPTINAQYEYAQISIVPTVSEAEENAIKDKLRDIKRRVENGENFSMFAVLYSECPSAKSGGDLGYFGKATMDPAFSAAAFALKPGQISNVVKSEAGYHIIQMTDRMGDKIRCKHILLKPEVKIEEKEKLANKLDSIADCIRKGKLSFEEAAFRFSTDKNSRNGGGMVINPQDMSTKFEVEMLPPEVSKVLTNLEINEISKPFFATDDKGRDVIEIVKLINKTPAHKANITEDYQLISDRFLEKKKNDLIQDWISKRQSKTYIRIDETYQNCDFKYKNWIK
ncbi:MAG TPA: peptidylprolyl isomerase [Prolixibacteraceae bacterium]|nr:peptidylprolyl isomerase [Prolixibacteraceae bacterium]